MRWNLPASLLMLSFAHLPASIGMSTHQVDELAALEAEFNRAQGEWEAYRVGRGTSPPSGRRPSDPVATFWPRFVALMEAGHGRAALWLVENASRADLQHGQRLEKQAGIVAYALREHVREPWLEQLCFLVAKHSRDFEPEELTNRLETWQEEDLEPQVRAAANWLWAHMIRNNREVAVERDKEIEAALRAALSAAPTSAAGRIAGSSIFSTLERKLGSELRAWLDRSPGGQVLRPDLGSWRAHFRELAVAGVEEAEIWLLGTAWAEKPGADYEQLLAMLDETREIWRHRLEVAKAEQRVNPFGLKEPPAVLRTAPEELFWLAFEALADRDPRAGAWLIENASRAPYWGWAVRDRLFQELEEIVRDHGDAEWAVGLTEGLARGAADYLGARRVRELCVSWADATNNEEVEIRLRLQHAVALLKQDEAQGVALLRELVERWPDHALARDASGRITSLTELVIGQPAPDIVAPDLAGEPFKLSDYRGKVVVLDFWGDW